MAIPINSGPLCGVLGTRTPSSPIFLETPPWIEGASGELCLLFAFLGLLLRSSVVQQQIEFVWAVSFATGRQ